MQNVEAGSCNAKLSLAGGSGEKWRSQLGVRAVVQLGEVVLPKQTIPL